MKTNNELIAAFMGEDTDIDLRDPSMHTRNFDGVPCYDQYWDWLMPVVEKIETLEHTVLIGREYCEIKHQNYRIKHGSSCSSSKIESVHQAVVEFIKWYNTNQE
jgi:hypothetical protein